MKLLWLIEKLTIGLFTVPDSPWKYVAPPFAPDVLATLLFWKVTVRTDVRLASPRFVLKIPTESSGWLGVKVRVLASVPKPNPKDPEVISEATFAWLILLPAVKVSTTLLDCEVP